MTLWQDPPPQTRRQARENEREAALRASNQLLHPGENDSEDRPESAVPAPITPVSTPYGSAPAHDDASDDAAPGSEDSSGASSAESLEQNSGQPHPAIPEQSADASNPAQSRAGLSAFGSPSRPQLPNYEASFDSLLGVPRESAVSPEPSDGDTDGHPETAEELFRVSADTGETEPITRPVNVVTNPAPVNGMPASVSQWKDEFENPSASPEAAALANPERTLTRRELRAILQAQEANEKATGHGGDAVVNEPAAPIGQQPPQVAPIPIFTAPPAQAPVVSPAEAKTEAATVGDRVEPAADDSPAPYQTPVGHWSTAGELDEQNQPFDQIISRHVGQPGSATTTNALILPSVPSVTDATGPLTATGEILVTGSIDLPRGIGATGAHPDHYDSAEMDRMFDQAEGELNSSNVAPIRASRAVSGHTSTRGSLTPPKKSRGRLPLVLSITAGVLLLAVVGLLIAGYVLKVF